MTLLEEIQSRKPHRVCAFGRWLESAPKQDRADIQTAFADPTIKAKWIADALADRCPGNIVDSVRDHRRGDCSICPPSLLNDADDSGIRLNPTRPVL